MGKRLRAEVEVTQGHQMAHVLDRFTGLQLQLDGDWSALSRSSGLSDQDGQAWTLVNELALLDEGIARAEIEARQRRARGRLWSGGRPGRLQELLDFCVQRVPYYRERSGVYGLQLGESVDGMQQLPLMGKPDLRTHFTNGLVAEGLDIPGLLERRSLDFAATSGTTGERLQVFADMELDSVPVQYEEMWGLPTTEAVPRTAVFTTPTCLGTACHLGKAPFEERLRGPDTLFLNSLEDLFSMRRELVESIAEELERFGPDFFLVNPMYMHWLARCAEQWSIRLPKPTLIMSCYQYPSRIQRRALERLLDAPVYSYYFATDLSGCRIGIECNRRHLHVREDQTFLEVVGADGLRKAPGQTGTFALTAVGNRTMPLVRYVVGDVGRELSRECDCAVSEWPLFEMHGRLKDLLWLGGRWVTTREVDDLLGDAPGVDFYRAVQTGEDSLAIEVIPELGANDPSIAVREAARRLPGVREAQVKVVKRLEPEASLKFRLTEGRFRAPPEFL